MHIGELGSRATELERLVLSRVLPTDVVNDNASADTIADVPGLSFVVRNGGTYWFRFVIWYTAAASTTGSRWAVNGPTASLLAYRQSWALDSAAGTDAMTEHNADAYDAPAAANATSPAGVNLAIIEGLITASAAGAVVARFASEVSGSAITAKAGSVVFYQRVL